MHPIAISIVNYTPRKIIQKKKKNKGKEKKRKKKKRESALFKISLNYRRNY
jgi:hypothetical protein